MSPDAPCGVIFVISPMRGLMRAGVWLSKLPAIMAHRHTKRPKHPLRRSGLWEARQPDMRLHSVMAATPTTTMSIGQKASMALQPGNMHSIDPNTKPSIAE